jgi:hypothetical protein
MAVEKSKECSICGIEIHGEKLMMKLHMKRHGTKQAD